MHHRTAGLERETSEVEQARQALEALQSEENDFSSKLARLQQALQEALVEVARKEAGAMGSCALR